MCQNKQCRKVQLRICENYDGVCKIMGNKQMRRQKKNKNYMKRYVSMDLCGDMQGSRVFEDPAVTCKCLSLVPAGLLTPDLCLLHHTSPTCTPAFPLMLFYSPSHISFDVWSGNHSFLV